MGLMEELRAARVAPGGLALWWLGQSGFAVKTPAGLLLLVDPYLSDAASDGRRHARHFPPPIVPAELGADLIALTHDHPDHTDPETLGPLLRRAMPPIIGPPSSCRQLADLGLAADRLHHLQPGDRYAEADLSIEATPALHGEVGPPERRPRRPAPDAIGLLLRCGPLCVYHTGDTLYDRRLLAVAEARPQALLTCINGQGGNMDATEAARLAGELGVRLAVPMHYGTIVANDARPEPFVAALRVAAPAAVALLPVVGRRIDLPLPAGLSGEGGAG